MKVHASAIISPDAEVADSVEVGPFCIIEAGAKVGADCKLSSHVTIHGCASIGERNVFHQGCVIGDEPQDYSYGQEPTLVEIGNDNTFREYVTVHRGTAKDRGLTTVGNRCLFMAYSHVAHDCDVRNNVLLTNCAQLAGHSILFDNCSLSAFSGVHQYCRVGRFAYIGASTIATQDIIPFALVVSNEKNRADIKGPNLVGLKRAGFTSEQLRTIRAVYKTLFHSSLNTTQALDVLRSDFEQTAEVTEIIDFIQSAKRGIAKC